MLVGLRGTPEREGACARRWGPRLLRMTGDSERHGEDHLPGRNRRRACATTEGGAREGRRGGGPRGVDRGMRSSGASWSADAVRVLTFSGLRGSRDGHGVGWAVPRLSVCRAVSVDALLAATTNMTDVEVVHTCRHRPWWSEISWHVQGTSVKREGPLSPRFRRSTALSCHGRGDRI